MRPTLYRLVQDGLTWDEADARLSDLAEEALNDEWDRRLLEHFEQLKHARALENFDGRG